MKRAPVPTNQPLLDRALLSRIPLMALSSVSATFGWFVYRISTGASPSQAQTETFTALAICQWLNVLNCRSAKHSVFSKNLIRNHWLLFGLVVGIALHAAVIYWPPLSQFFHTTPIHKTQLLGIGLVVSSVLWTEEIRKLIARTLRKRRANAEKINWSA